MNIGELFSASIDGPMLSIHINFWILAVAIVVLFLGRRALGWMKAK